MCLTKLFHFFKHHEHSHHRSFAGHQRIRRFFDHLQSTEEEKKQRNPVTVPPNYFEKPRLF